MKVTVLPIKSKLHKKELLNELTNSFLNKLNDSDIQIELVNSFKELYKEDSDLPLILVQSGGSENEFLKMLTKLNGPYYLLTYGSNNSLAASLEILTYLKNRYLEGEVLHGDIEYIKGRIRELASSYKEKANSLKLKKKKEVRLGVIGEPSDWLISTNVDREVINSKFNISLVDIETDEIEKLYKDKNLKFFRKDEESYLRITNNELEKAYRLYRCLDLLVKKYKLNGFTIRCFDLLSSLKTTACLALSIFNNRPNFIATCEGDIPCMIGMYIAKTILCSPSFQCNPSKIDAKKDEIILAHCTLPLCMCQSFRYNTHFESGIGIGIKGELMCGDITIFRLNNKFDKIFVREGRIEENLSRDDLCRTQVVCNVENIKELLQNPLGNHLLIVYGKYKEQLESYFNKINK